MNIKKTQEFYPAALTIAGSDSGGGAGIQADLRAFSAFGVYGASAVTALTAQNPSEVLDIHPSPPEFLEHQLEAVFRAFKFGAAKTGMLHNSGIIEKIIPFIEKYRPVFIVDPVMVSTSGTALLNNSAVKTIQNVLLPMADWITPNIPEAEILANMKINNRNAVKNAAAECSRRYKCSCVIKGGHMDSRESATDIIFHQDNFYSLTSPLSENRSALHGTGCALSAAMTAAFALGFDWSEALSAAKAFVFGSLTEAVRVGNETFAMYPPGKSYINNIELKKVK